MSEPELRTPAFEGGLLRADSSDADPHGLAASSLCGGYLLNNCFGNRLVFGNHHRFFLLATEQGDLTLPFD